MTITTALLGILMISIEPLSTPAPKRSAQQIGHPRLAQAPNDQTAEQKKRILIWGGGVSPADAKRARVDYDRVLPRLKEFAATVPEGYPQIIASKDHSGLNPGFHILVLGVCSPADARKLLARIRPFYGGAYFRDLKDSPLPYSCPTLGDQPPLGHPRPVTPADLDLYCDGLLSTTSREVAEDTPSGFAEAIASACEKRDVPRAREAFESVTSIGPGACFSLEVSIYRGSYEATISQMLPDRERHTRLYCVSRPGPKADVRQFHIISERHVYYTPSQEEQSTSEEDDVAGFDPRTWEEHRGVQKVVRDGPRVGLCIEHIPRPPSNNYLLTPSGVAHPPPVGTVGPGIRRPEGLAQRL